MLSPSQVSLQRERGAEKVGEGESVRKRGRKLRGRRRKGESERGGRERGRIYRRRTRGREVYTCTYSVVEYNL